MEAAKTGLCVLRGLSVEGFVVSSRGGGKRDRGKALLLSL